MALPTAARRGRLLLALVIAASASACGDDGGDDARPDDPARFADESLDVLSNRPRDDPSPETTVTTGEAPPSTSLNPTDIPGEPVNQFDLEVGDCFDRLEDLQDGRPIVITTRLPCTEPHHLEVFHRLLYPAGYPSLYPGERVLRDFAVQSCYREFEAWVGNSYELSALEIEVLVPPQANFEDDRARYRGIHCFVERVDGEPMTGSSRGSGR